MFYFIHIFNIILFICLGIALIFAFWRIAYVIIAFFKSKPLKETNQHAKFAIIIPARNESNVISRLLNSLNAQDYPKEKFEVFVVLDKADQTTEIVKKFNYNAFVVHPNHPKGKGNAINALIQNFKENNKIFDAYVIFDADNVAKENFLTEMNKAYQTGVKLGAGYRNTLNKPGNLIADCSALMFSDINTFQNKGRTALKRNILISGTGFFIDAEVVNSAGGWVWTTLTEDYQLSLYCALNNVKSAYIPSAEYFDEQPTSLKVLNKQRVRWIKGFFQSRKLYRKQIYKSLTEKENRASKWEFALGVVPNLVAIVSLILYFVTMIGIFIFALASGFYSTNQLLIPLLNAVFLLVYVYAFLFIFTIFQLIAERKYFKFGFFNSIKILFLNPLFICLYIPHATKAIFSKNVKWQPIEHGVAQGKF